MANILINLIAICAIALTPWLGRIAYRRARRAVEAGDPLAKVRLYRLIVIEQIVTAVALGGLLLSGKISVAALGLREPRALSWNIIVLAVLVYLLMLSAVLLRPKAPKLRQRFRNSIGALLPDSRQERSWFGAISIGAGLSEELLFRGFLMYYFITYGPHVNTIESLLLTSLFFGFAHIYQGWRGALGAGILGLLLGAAYVLSGSLLLPIVLHAVADLRVLLIFPPTAQHTMVEGAV